MNRRIKSFLGRQALPPMLAFLFLSALYLYCFPQPTIFYALVVLLHAVVGVVASGYLAAFLFGLLRESTAIERFGWLAIASSAAIGIVLLKLGTPRSELNWLYLHILSALTGAGILFSAWAGRRQTSRERSPRFLPYGLCFLVITLLSAGA
ncbi:MAG: hypothetical protein JO356_13570, partial [Acidobacteria bacterium]|nr:hypothetical protein [Acidobacteriota bacterium]